MISPEKSTGYETTCNIQIGDAANIHPRDNSEWNPDADCVTKQSDAGHYIAENLRENLYWLVRTIRKG